jgi:Uma2 family endonuclease
MCDRMSTVPTAATQSVTYGLDASIARFSVDRYQRMVAADILGKEDKVELLEGDVVLKMPGSPRHDSTIQRVQGQLYRLVPAGWGIRIKSAVALSDSQPEPDVAVVRGDARNYATRHPGPDDIGLLMEIADASLLRDTADKTRIYARANIPVYWVIDLVHRRIQVYTRPSGPTAAPAYADCQTFQPGDTVPLELDGVNVAAIPAADLLP